MKRNLFTNIATAVLLLTLCMAAFAGCGSAEYTNENTQTGSEPAPYTATALVAVPLAASVPAAGNVIALYIGSPNAIVNGNLVKIDDNASIVPYIENSRALMPLRFVADTLGFTVEWRESDSSVTLSQTGLGLGFKLGSNIMRKNNEDIPMETAAVSANGRIFVPIAYVAEAMGMNAVYDRGLILLANSVPDENYINAMISRLSGLPFVGSTSEFNNLLKDLAAEDIEQVYYNIIVDDLAPGMRAEAAEAQADGFAAASPPAAVTQSAAGAAGDYSSTNIQVQGVDEADIIKTDGQYIYHLSDGKLHIIKADGRGNMEKTAVINFEPNRGGYYPNDMYIDGDRLCVIGSLYLPSVVYGNDYPGEISGDVRSVYSGRSFIRLLVYDISVKSAPVKKREFTVEGSLISSRKVDNTLYLVANKHMYFYGVTEPSDMIPLYSDKAGADLIPLSCGTMRYFPDAVDRSMLIICGIDIKDDSAEAKINSILGSGTDIFMSRTGLYIAKYNYGYMMPRPFTADGGNTGSADKTSFYKFVLDNGNVVYNAVGVADGNVLNQYSMDEYNGYFRVATTVGWSSKNVLTVFNQSMDAIGKIDNMAPGEQIYSTRFMGDRAFIVTFRTVDPLFAIDLSSPSNPRVLGELKIPGYSTYLHPYDENRLIGFGRDTEELTTTDARGNIVDTRAVNRGLKLALFDISDMSKPREISVMSIGNSYADSHLLYNPKAFLFSKEKGFIAFPVTQYPNTDYDGTIYEAFEGAYVYNINPDGINLRGKITHEAATRIIYIGDTFYTASHIGIQANDMGDLRKLLATSY